MSMIVGVRHPRAAANFSIFFCFKAGAKESGGPRKIDRTHSSYRRYPLHRVARNASFVHERVNPRGAQNSRCRSYTVEKRRVQDLPRRILFVKSYILGTMTP